MTREKFALLIGKVKDDSCWRCEDSKLSSGEVALEAPLTRIWFRDRPIKSSDAAVAEVTNAGSNSGLL
jgi:hypothetical protein